MLGKGQTHKWKKKKQQRKNPILKVMEAETLMPTEAGRKEETKAFVVRH